MEKLRPVLPQPSLSFKKYCTRSSARRLFEHGSRQLSFIPTSFTSSVSTFLETPHFSHFSQITHLQRTTWHPILQTLRWRVSTQNLSRSATRRKSFSWLDSKRNCIKLIEKGAVNRPVDQEDEDTEQKIINEGSYPNAERDGTCSQFLQSTRPGRRTPPFSMT